MTTIGRRGGGGEHQRLLFDFDGVVETGDFITTDQITCQVVSVGLRVTKIRSFGGKLWYVRNGKIQVVGNTSREWVRAIANVGLVYEEDVARGMRLVGKVAPGQHWAVERDWLERTKDAFDAQGIEIPFPRGVMYLRQDEVAAKASRASAASLRDHRR